MDSSTPHLTDDTILGMTYAPPSSVVAAPTLNSNANISIREYIYFLPYPLPSGTPVPYTPGLPNNNPLNLPPHPFEPTSTLVLTSPKKAFVDIRYFKPVKDGASALPNQGETKRLEWGFAGTSSSIPSPSSPHEKHGEFAHSSWAHWLDSRYHVAHPSIPVDEGHMYNLSETLTLEHGFAFHPHLGRVAGHEELWRDVEAESTNAKGTKICVLLRCEDDAQHVRGVVIRIGQFCQGILQHKSDTTTERWEFDFEDEGTENEERSWKRTARTGDLFLPCNVTFRPEILSLGGKVRYGDFEWLVEELWEWA